MATCPTGHQTNQTDFCDTCGLPVTGENRPADREEAAAMPSTPPTVICPNCGAGNVAEALFCESCGYDFTTGTVTPPVSPTPPWPRLVPVPVSEPEAALTGEQAEVPHPDAAPAPAPQWPRLAPVADAPAAVDTQPAAAAPLSPSIGEGEDAQPDVRPPVVAGSAPDQQPATVMAADSPPEAPELSTGSVVPPRPAVEWVAELWIDPDWYAAQGSTDPMPSVGLPDIVGLVKTSNLIGRVSHSKGIFPDIDCELDSGCSRRHAMLTTDWTRWWIEDLNSANGTFVGNAAGPLPGMPIPQGRVELASGQRIYLGAWTRIVIRKATDDEREAFAG
jgi:hypothetical protein